MPRVPLVATGIALALIGCAPDPNTDFLGLPNLRVDVLVNRRIDTNDSDPRRPSTVEVDLHYDADAFIGDGDGRHCAVIDAGGTFNGVDLDLTQAGEYDDFDCIEPTFQASMQLGATDAGHLVLHDNHDNAISAELAPGVAAARIATLESPASWGLTGGDRVSLRWSHPEDLVGIAAADVSVTFGRPGDGAGFEMPIDSIDATHISLTVPANPAVKGDGDVDIIIGQYGGGFATGDATSCVGATRCTYSAVKAYEHTASMR